MIDTIVEAYNEMIATVSRFILNNLSVDNSF